MAEQELSAFEKDTLLVEAVRLRQQNPEFAMETDVHVQAIVDAVRKHLELEEKELDPLLPEFLDEDEMSELEKVIEEYQTNPAARERVALEVDEAIAKALTPHEMK